MTLRTLALTLVSAGLGLAVGPCLAAEITPTEPPALAVAADLRNEGSATRLTVTLSRTVQPTAFVLRRPDRAVVDLPDVNCQLPPDSLRRRVGLVAGLRCGLIAAGRTRLIVDLAGAAEIARLEVVDTPIDTVKHLLVDFIRQEPTRSGAGARAESVRADEPGTTGSLPAGQQAWRPLVAIDAGHGGIDPGTTASTGDFEKDVVLAFARSLRDRLVASDRVRVTMIRDADVFVPLDDRVRIARAAGADLFVSIHGDSIASPSVRGATIYTGAERATDAESARLAERENEADRAGGILPAEARAGVSDILHELTLRETRGLSHRFAGMLHSGLAPTMRFSQQPHREAGFRVLRAADMTSVLVELGYLSNAQDVNLLLSDDWRRRASAGMADAIERFFGPRLVRRAAVSP